jgi:ribosomal protein S8
MSRLVTLPHRLCTHLINTSHASLAATSVPYSKSSLAITSVLLRHGLISNLTLGSPTNPAPKTFHDLPVPARRLWIAHKYRNGSPVLRRMELVSKPSSRRFVSKDELGRILVGKRAQNVAGVGMGEVLVIRVEESKTRDTYMEGWEAWRAGHGGEIVCRAG